MMQGKKVAEKYDVPVGIVTAENADEMNAKIWGN
jgi:hypothetical protein